MQDLKSFRITFRQTQQQACLRYKPTARWRGLGDHADRPYGTPSFDQESGSMLQKRK
jgi:hypothetical protein